MEKLQNDRLIRALLREPVDVTPVWMMRQAGRYLPEYREIRKQAGSFMNLCTNPELACEVTLQPLERFPLDAAILLSDILTIPDAMGLGLYFEEGEGPRFKKPVRTSADVKALGNPDPETELRYVMDAVRLIRKELDNRVPMLYNEPVLLHKMLNTVSRTVTAYLNAQIAAGAQVVMIFDTWGGVLTPDDYHEFSLNYMQKIVGGLAREHDGTKVPVILFTKGGCQWLEDMADTGADALGIDWSTDLATARKRVGNRVALQGNLDPATLYAEPDIIYEKVAGVLKQYGTGSGHVFNLGHGINPDIDPENVAAMINAVHQISERYHI